MLCQTTKRCTNLHVMYNVVYICSLPCINIPLTTCLGRPDSLSATNQYLAISIQRLEDRPEGYCLLEGSAVMPTFRDSRPDRQVNQCMVTGDGSNHCVELFIDYLYLHFTVENIPEGINGHSGRTPGPGSRG